MFLAPFGIVILAVLTPQNLVVSLISQYRFSSIDVFALPCTASVRSSVNASITISHLFTSLVRHIHRRGNANSAMPVINIIISVAPPLIRSQVQSPSLRAMSRTCTVSGPCRSSQGHRWSCGLRPTSTPASSASSLCTGDNSLSLLPHLSSQHPPYLLALLRNERRRVVVGTLHTLGANHLDPPARIELLHRRLLRDPPAVRTAHLILRRNYLHSLGYARALVLLVGVHGIEVLQPEVEQLRVSTLRYLSLFCLHRPPPQCE